MADSREVGTDDAPAATPTVGHREALVARVDVRTDAVSLAPGPRAVVSALGIAIQGLVRFVYSLLIGRTLPPGFLSATNSAISTALLATMLWPTSIGAAAAKFLARESQDPELRSALTHHLARLAIVTSTALGVGAGLLTSLLLSPGDATTGVLVALLTTGWSGYTFVRGVQYATGRVLRATVWDALSFVVAVAGLVLVLLLGHTAWLLVPLTVGYAVYTVAGWPRCRPGPVSRELRREINRFVAWGVLASLATGGFLQLTMVLAEQTGDAVSADAYAAALTLATPASMLGSVLGLLLLPSLSAAIGRGDLAAARGQTDLAHRMLVVATGAVFGTLVVGSRLVVGLLWPGLSEAVPVLEVLLAATFLLTLCTVVTESIRSYDHEGARVVALSRTAGFVVGLGTVLVLMPTLSVFGIAIGYLAGMAVTGLVPVAVVWRRDRQSWALLHLKIAGGAALAGFLSWARPDTGGPGWIDPVLALAFLAAWLTVHRTDVVRLVRASGRTTVPR
ncbi:polysaccharide biosynthesis protein [Saccharomonospora iraqiensis]|uniref:hypothetical protein n=1 Tax=Saccharomonospora iraqiensis TaxID=52698 RepID=UPI00054D142D|nr:hypothetical protein [Saccharomonospora iraqiensis]